MHRRLVSSGLTDKFGFMCPVHATDQGNTAAIRHRYLAHRLSETETECFLVPYVYGDHWQLVLLCKTSYTVILLCSLHFKPGSDLKKTVNSAMRTFLHTKCGRHVRDLKDPTWIMPKTRRQPPGSNLCGLYILRQIYNIISLGTTDFTEEMFDLPDPFPEKDIDFIKRIIAEFIYELLQD